MKLDDSSRTHSLPLALGVAGAGLAAAAYLLRQRRRLEFAGKTVLISGGSRGLGLELARGFAAEGARLALLARDPDELAGARRELERRGAQVMTLRCDITREDEVRKAVAAAAEPAGIDVLINNAGIIQVGPVEQMETADFAAAMDTHFWGPLYLTRAVIDRMRRSGGGRIVNIASIGGKIAVPHLLPYVASKFALVGLSEGLRAELLKDRIYVTTVAPGLMRTGSHLNALFKGQHRKEFALFSIANAIPGLSTDSRNAARQIIEGCRYGSAEIVIGWSARAARVVHDLLPAPVSALLGVVARALPGPSAVGWRLKRGWQSRSALAPRFLTSPSDRAAQRNRENPQPAPE